MKILFIYFLPFFLFFISCQKELSYESSLAEGFLIKNSNGECKLNTAVGNFYKDSILTPNNYIDVEVSIIKAGIYSISTDTINGYSFSQTGLANDIGIFTIRLQASGKCIKVGLDNFKVTFTNSSCSFSNKVVLAPILLDPNAIFTLGTTVGICTDFVLGSGTYNAGIAMGSNNTVTLKINVTRIGVYTVNASTTPSVGVGFTGTGNLPNLGPTTITLTAQGTSNNTAAITKTYSISAGGTTCSFDVHFNAASQFATYFISCNGISTTGNYIATYPLNDWNTIKFNVNVTTAGAYSITTDLINGVKFASSGVLTLGNNVVTLKAVSSNNIPQISNIFNYQLFGGSGGSGSACTFSIPYSTAPPIGSNIITANVNTVPKTYNIFTQATNTSLGGINTISLYGKNSSTGSEQILITIEDEFNAIAVGNPYTINSAPQFINAKFTNNSNIEFLATTTTQVQTNPFTITFTEISVNRLRGSFTGVLKKDNIGPKESILSNGNFDIGL